MRVAAIIITIKQGVSNNCGIGRNKKHNNLSLITTKHTPCNGSNIWNRVNLNGQLSLIETSEGKLPSKCIKVNTFDENGILTRENE